MSERIRGLRPNIAVKPLRLTSNLHQDQNDAQCVFCERGFKSENTILQNKDIGGVKIVELFK